MAFMALARATGRETDVQRARAALRRRIPLHEIDDLGVCHGLAGYGEILLELHAQTNSPDDFGRARQVFSQLNRIARHDPERGITWVSADRRESLPTAALMVGNGGIAHFVLRVIRKNPLTMGFPLLS